MGSNVFDQPGAGWWFHMARPVLLEFLASLPVEVPKWTPNRMDFEDFRGKALGKL